MTKHDFRFTPQDHERMKEALDNLSDNPTEEEAEAVLQACGTSGKEVVNEFIERLLKENLGLKQELARRAAIAGPRGDADWIAETTAREYVSKSLMPDDAKLELSRNDYWQRAKGAEKVLERIRAAATASPAPVGSRVADMAEPKSEVEPACVHCGRELESREYGPPINDIVWSHIHNGVVWCDWPAPAESTRVAGELYPDCPNGTCGKCVRCTTYADDSARRAAEELERENWLLSDVTPEEREKVVAIISKYVPAEREGAAHHEPNWLWCERCQAWIETAHQCGARYIDRGTYFELVEPAAPAPKGDR